MTIYASEKVLPYVYRLDNPFYGKKHTPENIEHFRDIRIGISFEEAYGKERSDEIKSKMSVNSMGIKNSFFGKTHTDETKMLISLSKIGIPSPFKGIPKSKIMCPHCQKECNAGNAARWHFDKCKLKSENITYFQTSENNWIAIS